MNKELETAAEKYANDKGYPQSDKEHFETAFWTQHNIASDAFIAGANWLLQQSSPIDDEGISELGLSVLKEIGNKFEPHSFVFAFIKGYKANPLHNNPEFDETHYGINRMSYC